MDISNKISQPVSKDRFVEALMVVYKVTFEDYQLISVYALVIITHVLYITVLMIRTENCTDVHYLQFH